MQPCTEADYDKSTTSYMVRYIRARMSNGSLPVTVLTGGLRMPLLIKTAQEPTLLPIRLWLQSS